jgi:2-polyprenyl-3-methyl-5-hydroxy-6-metoxy-1,4-benzoquinol methylase
MSLLDDFQIIRSWSINAAAWIKAISNHEIESRNLVTNQAILKTIIGFPSNYILDVGCGEGWLAHELAAKGIRVFGVDAFHALIEQAKKTCNGQFDVCSYEELHKYGFKEKFDCIVCNFSLLGKESTVKVISAAQDFLHGDGRLIIQTLHPVLACGDLQYVDGWRPGSWSGFSIEFTEPAPWYFRTIASWNELLNNNQFENIKIYEPNHPKTGKPV